jgi:sorting nexin-1/2
VITSIGEFADAVAVLGSSDLSKQLSNSLAVMADVERKAKEILEEQSRFDVVTVLGTGKSHYVGDCRTLIMTII